MWFSRVGHEAARGPRQQTNLQGAAGLCAQGRSVDFAASRTEPPALHSPSEDCDIESAQEQDLQRIQSARNHPRQAAPQSGHWILR